MLASTAMPTDRINPAMPAAVKGNRYELEQSQNYYGVKPEAKTATKPGNLYHKIRNKDTKIIP